jgi:CRP-like cAMP-binding protein
MADTQLFEKYGNLIPAGQVIFRENEEGSEMFIIQDGKVRISKNIGGKEHILAVLTKGDFFGEMAIVTKVTRSATATAVTDTHLLSFDRQGFRGMIEKNSKIAMNIIDKLCRRLQHSNMQIQHFKRRNEPSLVALNLLYAFEAADTEGGSIPLERTVEEISLSLEAPANEIRKIIEEYGRQGILSVESDTVRMIDRDRLKAAVENAAASPEEPAKKAE